MFKQGRICRVVFPFNLWQKLFFSIGMIGIGMLAYGSSVLFNRLAKKITNRGE
ncbi:hypothetical protein [Bacillus thuringiensis]|uniref:hypothetical protein n=1 Tax=Bacillus thuringiensis TaxID=1428 RepID=UPI002FBE5C1E